MRAETAALPRAVRDLLEGLLAGAGELPMLPDVAREVLALCQADDVDAVRLSAVLHRDPSLAAHVLKVANSPLYRSSVAIASLQQAVSRLGMKVLSEIAVAAAVRSKLFNRPEARGTMTELWRHSLAAACFGKEVARTRRRNVESSFLCCLLHDVGKPVILSALLDGGVAPGAAAVAAAMDAYHTEVGAALARRWQLPAAVEESIRFHHGDWASAPTSAEAAMTACLADHLAHLVAPVSWRAATEEEVRMLPVLEALNLYPDELDALLLQRRAVLEQVKVVG